MDGYLKIKTKIDNSGVDKDIQQLEDKIKKLQEDNLKQSDSQRDLQAEIDKYEQLTQKSDEYHQKIKELKAEQKGMFSENGTLPSGQFERYQAIADQIKQAEAEEIKLNAEIDKQAPKIDKVYTKLEQVKKKQTENNAKITQFKQKIEQINTNNIRNSIDNIGKSLTGHISKLGKMALAVAGIRTAWMGVRRIISMVSSYDKQISTDLEYMGFAIANVFAPAVQGLIKLLYTVLSYVNAIMSAWFGINIFSRSSADSFKKMKSSAGSTAKSAKEIQKALQGFDEMNILSDNSSSSSGAGGGAIAPSVDLSGMQADIPQWLQWIIDNKDLVIAIIGGITGALIAMKLLGLDPLLSLGIGILITGIIKLIKDVIKFIKDPSWENFINIVEDIGIALIGLGVIIGVLTENWLLLIIGLIVLIVTEVVKHWDDIKEVLGKVGIWINENIIQPVVKFFQDLWEKIKTGVTNAWNNAIDVLSAVGNWIYTNIIEPVGKFFKDLWDGFKTGAKNAWDGITNVFSNVGNFFSGIISKIIDKFKSMGLKVGEVVSGAFRGVVNGILGAVEKTLNTPIRAVNRLIGVINNVPGINLGYLNTFNLPRLARGGIITQPTKAIIGEAGKEAVIPLENNLEYLDLIADKLASRIGSNSGSYIINMDSRTIQRGIAKRQQELAFMTNGR